MKVALYLSAFIAVVTSATITIADQLRPPLVFGSTPPAFVNSWIKYVVLGPRNSMFPIVLISPQRFKTSGYPEALIVLRHPRYDVVASFTQARDVRPDCAGTKRKFAAWYTVEISEHADGKTRKCALRQEPACRYLSGVLRLPGVDWTAEERKPIDDFMRSIKC